MDPLIADRPGYTPMIARLVGMMDYARETTLQAVQGMSTEELDTVPPEFGNSAGMLLEHFAAVEVYYQTFSASGPQAAEAAIQGRWMPGMALGTLGQEAIRGHALGYYLKNLSDVRAETLRIFREHDDAWLDESLPLWGTTGNRHFMYFHTFEDELNHRGQIRLIAKFLPRLRNRGMTGANFVPAREGGAGEGGLGLRCAGVWPGSVAADAGLQVGDVVLDYDGQDVTATPYWEIPLAQPVGTPNTLRVRRGGAEDGAEHAFTVTRVALPS